jgi:hypothetical protein
MLEFLREAASDRKLALLAVAFCRLLGIQSWATVDVAERHSDSLATAEELNAAWVADDVQEATYYRHMGEAEVDGSRALLRVVAAPRAELGAGGAAVLGGGRHRGAVVRLIHEIFGPCPSPAFSPAWRTATAVSLAHQMYEARDFSVLPILADALQDAGCDSAEILDHCRDPKQAHVRGCWVVDLALGKS